jgi:hypothetical protein
MSPQIQTQLEAPTLAKRSSVGVIFPSGMLGSGFSAESIDRGLELGASAIAIDAGSTDSGPHYLGAGVSKNTAAAIKRDLRILLLSARRAQIPLIVGSCATSGTDAGVDWTAQIADEIAREERLDFTLARIYSEQSPDVLSRALEAGRVMPLPPADELDEATLRSCDHIVGAMGHEPIVAALNHGADVVLAGRASDTSLVAAVALMTGLPPGPAWHAAKTVECGDQCTTSPRGGGVHVEIDGEGFTVTPLDPEAICTPISVAAHMLYENANPFRLTEPSGVLDTSDARYTSLDGRTVRVTGSRFQPSAQATIKLEGSRQAGYETMSFVGIADPKILADIDAWTQTLRARIEARARDLVALEPREYELQLLCYGRNAILGALATPGPTPQEVGVMMRIRAADQATATAIAKTANPLLLHQPLSGMKHLPSFAFATSPAEIERGVVYEFVLNHVVAVDDPTELFRTTISRVPGD